MSRFLILCEGYDDRSFWSGWLSRLGCVSVFEAAGKDKMKLDALLQAKYQFRAVPKDYCLTCPNGDLVVVRPCESIEFIWRETARELNQREKFDRIVANLDSDRDAGDDPTQGRLQRLRDLIRNTTGQKLGGNPPFESNGIVVDLVVWSCTDPADSPGVPNQQTLERLICAAIAEASISAEHPQGWATSVLEFLQEAPRGGDGHKNYAHAYLAKYFAHYREDLFEAVWSREHFPGIAAQLEKRLRATGAWQVAEALLNPAEDSL